MFILVIENNEFNFYNKCLNNNENAIFNNFKTLTVNANILNEQNMCQTKSGY